MLNTEVKPAISHIHVVAGIIRHPKNSEKIFFTRRQKGQHLEDLWEFPGGKLESGESRFHALQRELEEETGIKVYSALPFHSVIHKYPEKVIYLDIWEVKNFSGMAHGREGQESMWLKPDEFSKYSFPEADLPVLKALALPAELFTTPNLTEKILDSYLLQLSCAMKKNDFSLLQFRSDHLDDSRYVRVASELNEICVQHNAELIIDRPELKSMQSTLFDNYNRRHFNSLIVSSLSTNPFDGSIICSASCLDSQELKLAEKLNCEFALISISKNQFDCSGKGWYQFNKTTLSAKIPVYASGDVHLKDLTVARYQGAIGVAGISEFSRFN